MTGTVVPAGKKSPSYGWVIMIVAWITGISMPLNMVKMTVLNPAIMEYFGYDVAHTGIVLAMFYLVGIILAFPGSFVVSKLGYRRTFAAALACGAIGSLIGYVTTSLPLFMASRVIEGCGFGLINLVGVPMLTSWFAPSKRGLPLGFWAIVATMGFVIGPVLFSNVYAATGDWRTCWLLTTVIDVVMLVVFLAFYRDAPFVWGDDDEPRYVEKAERAEAPKMSLKNVVKNPLIWLIGLFFFCEEAPFIGMAGFFTTYTTEMTAITLTTASLLTSVMTLGGAILNPIVGRLSDKMGNKVFMVVGLIGGVLYAWFCFQCTTVGQFIPVILCNILAGGIIPTMVWSAVPKVIKNQEDLPGGTAVIVFCQNIAMFLGSTVLGTGIQSLGWATAGHCLLAPLFLVGLIFLAIAWKKLP